MPKWYLSVNMLLHEYKLIDGSKESFFAQIQVFGIQFEWC